jgi:hypothetical protein
VTAQRRPRWLPVLTARHGLSLVAAVGDKLGLPATCNLAWAPRLCCTVENTLFRQQNVSHYRPDSPGHANTSIAQRPRPTAVSGILDSPHSSTPLGESPGVLAKPPASSTHHPVYLGTAERRLHDCWPPGTYMTPRQPHLHGGYSEELRIKSPGCESGAVGVWSECRYYRNHLPRAKQNRMDLAAIVSLQARSYVQLHPGQRLLTTHELRQRKLHGWCALTSSPRWYSHRHGC